MYVPLALCLKCRKCQIMQNSALNMAGAGLLASNTKPRRVRGRSAAARWPRPSRVRRLGPSRRWLPRRSEPCVQDSVGDARRKTKKGFLCGAERSRPSRGGEAGLGFAVGLCVGAMSCASSRLAPSPARPLLAFAGSPRSHSFLIPSGEAASAASLRENGFSLLHIQIFLLPRSQPSHDGALNQTKQ